MKKKKFLATILSIMMLSGSIQIAVLADDDLEEVYMEDDLYEEEYIEENDDTNSEENVDEYYRNYEEDVKGDSDEITISEAIPFKDVEASYKFFDAVNYCYGNKIMMGTEEDVFSPDESLTRAMLVAILYRYEGEPVVDEETNFIDIAEGAYYEEAVKWAYKEKIVMGMSDTEFVPNLNITREQLAAMIYRYTEYKNLDVETVGDDTNTLSYDDIFDVADYAKTAMHYCLANDLIVPRTELTIKPADDATRGESAQAIYAMSKLSSKSTIVNPMVAVEKKDIIDAFGKAFFEDDKNAEYFIIAGDIAQMQFEDDGVEYCVRMKKTSSFDEEVSGMYFGWDETKADKINGNDAEINYAAMDGTSYQACLWYDAEEGIMYSLSVEGKDLSKVDIKAIAETVE